jgi:hypothetical protein
MPKNVLNNLHWNYWLHSSGLEEIQMKDFYELNHELWEFTDWPRDLKNFSSGLCCLDLAG